MSVRNAIYNTTMKGLRKLTATRMDYAQNEIKSDLVRATVVTNTVLAPSLRRITLSAPEFHTLTLSGADEYFGLLIPQGDSLTMPDPSVDNIRAAVKEIPEDKRPALRWYTVRQLRNDAAELDIDIVTHGDSGPGSAWALSAEPGSEVGIRFLTACHYPHSGQQFYLADPTAMPALRAIVESMDSATRATTHVFIVAETDDLLEPTTLPEVASITRIDAPTATAPGAVTDALASAPFSASELSYAWLCGESSIVTTARRALVKQYGMDKKNIFFSGYWKLGAQRG